MSGTSFDERYYFKDGLTVSGGLMYEDVGTGGTAEATTVASIKKVYAQTASSGDQRLVNYRLYFETGASDGETGRFYSIVNGATAANAVHGIHASVAFAATSTCSGEVAAVRATLQVPSAVLGGTNGAVYAELWADGTASNMSNGQFVRCVLGGNATGLALLEDNVSLLSIEGGSNASGNIVSGVGNEPTWTSATHKVRFRANGTVMYLVAVLA